MENFLPEDPPQLCLLSNTHLGLGRDRDEAGIKNNGGKETAEFYTREKWKVDLTQDFIPHALVLVGFTAWHLLRERA